MKIALGIVLVIIGVIFGANALGSLGGRYGPANLWRNVSLASGVSIAAIFGGVYLLAS